jgi:hypothetical protein
MAYILISTPEYRAWKKTLDEKQEEALVERLTMLRNDGPQARRPYFGTLRGGDNKNLKEIIVTKRELRVIFIFDPKQNAVLLLGGDKSGDYEGWYDEYIPVAEELYRTYLTARDRTPYEEE